MARNGSGLRQSLRLMRSAHRMATIGGPATSGLQCRPWPRENPEGRLRHRWRDRARPADRMLSVRFRVRSNSGYFGEAESARCFDHRGLGLVLRIVSGDRQSGHDVRAPHASARGVGRCGHRARRHSRIVLCSDCSRDLGCRRTSSPAPAVLHCDRGCGLVLPHGSVVAEVAADHIALGGDGRIQAGDASDAGLCDTRRTYRPGGSRGSAAKDVAPVGLAAGAEAIRLTGSGTMLLPQSLSLSPRGSRPNSLLSRGNRALALWPTPALCPQRRLRRSPLAAASGRLHRAVTPS